MIFLLICVDFLILKLIDVYEIKYKYMWFKNYKCNLTHFFWFSNNVMHEIRCKNCFLFLCPCFQINNMNIEFFSKILISIVKYKLSFSLVSFQNLSLTEFLNKARKMCQQKPTIRIKSNLSTKLTKCQHLWDNKNTQICNPSFFNVFWKMMEKHKKDMLFWVNWRV